MVQRFRVHWTYFPSLQASLLPPSLLTHDGYVVMMYRSNGQLQSSTSKLDLRIGHLKPDQWQTIKYDTRCQKLGMKWDTLRMLKFRDTFPFC
jgi:hypothetical protein